MSEKIHHSPRRSNFIASGKGFLALCLLALSPVPAAFASFHQMQVEQVIAGVNGDLSAQAIQLRMRVADQDLVSQTRVRAWDATGSNPVVILDLTTDVLISSAGARILLVTPSFTTAVRALTPGFSPDFTMAQPIPASYLAAGRLTFENDSGSVLWSLAWGGSAYTGSNAGPTFNDSDGNFGPPFAHGLPTSGSRGLLIQIAASAFSTSNAADYALGPNPATVTKNDGSSFGLGSFPEISIQQPKGHELVDGLAKRSFGTIIIAQPSAAKTFTIKNLGSAALTGLAITKNGPNASDFSVGSLGKTSLASGATTTFKVTFTPSAAGTRTSAIHVQSNDANENPFDIKLTGMGGAP